MPPRVPIDVLEALHAQITGRPEGLAIKQLVELNRDTPRRTLQRHLARLVEMGPIVAVGKASARRYLPGSYSITWSYVRAA